MICHPHQTSPLLTAPKALRGRIHQEIKGSSPLITNAGIVTRPIMTDSDKFAITPSEPLLES